MFIVIMNKNEKYYRIKILIVQYNLTKLISNLYSLVTNSLLKFDKIKY